LHDELGQQLTGLGMMLAAFQQELKAEGNPHVAAVAEFSGLLRKAVAATRDLAKGFYPVVLEEGGLRVALQDLAHRTNAIGGVRCVIRPRPGFRFAKAHAIHLYRIAQEAVSNALKHGKPRTIEIVLTVQRGRSVMRIANDGRAFKPTAAGNGGFGLHLMRYRARYIGADVTVGRGRKGGCEVVCMLGVAGAEA
jgi:signal transduction histidine kinase